MSITPTSVPTKILGSSITASATSFTLNNILGWNGSALTSADFGTQAYCVFRNAARTQIEIMEFDPTTIASSSITIVRRGLKFTGDLTTEVSGNKYTWTKGDTYVDLGTDTPQLFQYLQTNFYTAVRYLALSLNTTTDLTVLDKAYIRIPSSYNGMNLVGVSASVGTGAAGSSSSGTPTFTVKNVTTGNQMLSTSLTVDAGEYTSATAAVPAVINTANDGVTTDDLIEVAVTTSGTGVTYAVVTLQFSLP